MLAAAPTTPTTSLLPARHHLFLRHCRPLRRQNYQLKPLSASSLPSPPSPTPYQPFRPPPPKTPPSLAPDAILSTLSNRLGLWFDYAPLIPLLSQHGFSPSAIEESTGISGVEQNRIVVAAKVRDTLVPTLDTDTLGFFDSGGAEILYEIRLLNNVQRVAAARRVVERRLDTRGAQEIARAMKDFPRRRGDPGWEDFSRDSPGDCVAFAHFRQSRENLRNLADAQAWLERAADEAETEAARTRIASELNRLVSGKDQDAGSNLAAEGIKVPVVRMMMGEVAEASSVVVLPVCGVEAEIAEAPECAARGEFGVVVAEKGWRKWVVLPGWEPVLTATPAAVAVVFPDARVLPWRTNRWQREEAVLVVTDRSKKAVEAEDSFYLVGGGGGGGGSLKVERGVRLKEKGVEEALGSVVLVVRPPREQETEQQQLSDEDWE